MTTSDTHAQAEAARLAGPREQYRFNHTYVPGVALADKVPDPEKAPLAWITLVVWQILRNVRNRLNWTQRSIAEGGPAAASDAPLSFSPDLGSEDEAGDVLELGSLGLDEPLDLTALPLEHPAPKLTEDDVAGTSGAVAFGGGLSATMEVARIVAGVIKTGLTDPLALLETLGRSARKVDTSRPASVDTYHGLFTLIEPPWFVKSMRGALDDDTFAWLRVAGPNPLVLEGVAGVDASFPVTEAHYRAALADPDDSLARAGAEGRLYLADYAALAGVESGVAPYRKYSFAPKALFALPRDARRLKPVAIQCGQDAREYAIFTPADGEGWLKAKFAVQSADGNHHELISHLGRTHLLIGPFVVSTHRQLEADHPVSKLLVPHFQGTLAINENARTTMLGKGKNVDQSLAGTIEASIIVAAKAFATPYFNHGMLPRWLESRRLGNPELEYPYRDDATLIWEATERWVSSYVRLHYETDAAVAADAALAHWAAEIVAPDGGLVTAFGEDGAGRIHTIAYLIQALTMIIFTASAQHAVVNFGQGDLMTLATATPVAAYAAAPRTHAEGAQGSWTEMVAPIDAAVAQVEFLSQLGNIYYSQLGQYPSGWFGRPEHDALERFQHDLTAIGAEITARNTKRPGPFMPLLPSKIPQSINI